MGAVEIRGNMLEIVNLTVEGPPVSVAEKALKENGSALQAVRQMLELGGFLMAYGQNTATVHSVSAEVDRVIAHLANVATHELPSVFDEHTQALSALMEKHLGVKSTDGIQQQVKSVMEAVAESHKEALIKALSSDTGPLAALRAELVSRFTVLDGRQDQLVKDVSAVAERITAASALKAEKERGAAKGLEFEEQVAQLVEWTFAPHDDSVFDVGTEGGSSGNRAGDILVVLNPQSTAGQDRRVVIEAKCRSLGTAATLRELDRAMDNREADAGIIVFADIAAAPTKGRSLRVYPGNRIVAVLDRNTGDSLALEAACHLARTFAVCESRALDTNVIDVQAISDKLQRLISVVDEAKMISRGVNAARKGLDQVDSTYRRLRVEISGIVDEIKEELQ